MSMGIGGFYHKLLENDAKVFRFYPRRSHVHGFDDECPKSWKEVYMLINLMKKY